jgi:NADH-quinone oxidoreductase subunit N
MAAVSVYYYFRVIQAMYFKDGDSNKLQTSKAFTYTLLALAALGIFLAFIQTTALLVLFLTTGKRLVFQSLNP